VGVPVLAQTEAAGALRGGRARITRGARTAALAAGVRGTVVLPVRRAVVVERVRSSVAVLRVRVGVVFGNVREDVVRVFRVRVRSVGVGVGAPAERAAGAARVVAVEEEIAVVVDPVVAFARVVPFVDGGASVAAGNGDEDDYGRPDPSAVTPSHGKCLHPRVAPRDAGGS
jgi:hypothetical protein